MKRTIAFTLTLVLILVCIPLTVSAADITLVTINGKSISETATIPEVNALFGQPKLETPSAFGGSAYTYYGSDGYTDFLYLETDADGQIIAYSTFDPSFSAYNYYLRRMVSYGETLDNTVIGYTYKRSGALAGFCFYRTSLFSYSRYWAEYERDSFTYAKGLQQHALAMYNAISKMLGKDSGFTFDERTFLINEQLKENGSYLYNYITNTSQSTYYRFITMSNTSFDTREVVSPLRYANYAFNYNTSSDTFPYPDFHFERTGTTSGRMVVGFVNPAVFADKNIIPLTTTEQAQLEEASRLYNASASLWTSQPAYYQTTPIYQTLPIAEGALSADALEATVMLVNAVRAGAGLSQLSHAQDLSDSAQKKAALTMYMAVNGISNPNPHNPAKPNGVSDAFYEGTKLGSGENLYSCGILGGYVITSITSALDDGYGDFITAGHRYNLLHPSYITLGVGEAGGQGVHKFGGYAGNDTEFVGWPSKGIMLMEAMQSNTFMWTAKFYQNYQIKANSSVTVRRLNDEKVWTFNNSIQNGSTRHFTATLSENMVSFFDTSMIGNLGDVFEITIHNVTRGSDGASVDYTYRSCYKKAYSATASGVSGISLSKNEMQLSVGQTEKLTTVIEPSNAANKMIYWVSTDPSVAIVDEYGRVTAVGDGTATVSAVTEDGGYMAGCLVTVKAGADLSGTVRVYLYSDTVIKLMQGSTIVKQITVDEVSGSSQLAAVQFLFESVPAGTYSLKVEKANHLHVTITDIVIAGSDIDLSALLSITPVAGDITGDGQVGLDDVAEVLKTANYNRTVETAENPNCDVNGDGMIGLEDISILLSTANYNKVHTVISYRDL